MRQGIILSGKASPQANRRRRFSPQPSRLLPEFGLFGRFLERCRHPATSSLSRWKSWRLGFESGSRHLCFYTFLGKILDSTEATTRRALRLAQLLSYRALTSGVPRENRRGAWRGRGAWWGRRGCRCRRSARPRKTRVHSLNNRMHGKKRVWEKRGKEI